MNLMQHPDTLDRIAASYALGSLRGGARRRFAAMARVQAPVRAAALVWQTRLSAMTELQEQVAPDPAVWTRILNLVQADRELLQMQRARVPTPNAPAVGGGGTPVGVEGVVVRLGSAPIGTTLAADDDQIAAERCVRVGVRAGDVGLFDALGEDRMAGWGAGEAHVERGATVGEGLHILERLVDAYKIKYFKHRAHEIRKYLSPFSGGRSSVSILPVPNNSFIVRCSSGDQLDAECVHPLDRCRILFKNGLVSLGGDGHANLRATVRRGRR